MTILDNILRHKEKEVETQKRRIPEHELRAMPAFSRTCISLPVYMLDQSKSGIIAEFKRASPSKGIINKHSTLRDVVKGYEAAGASAISVLTDESFFGGTLDDLVEARTHVQIPLLRKDFVINPYQIMEAKAYGADIILLIAAALEPEKIKELSEFAKSLGLFVLLEVHNRQELMENLFESIDAIGVNNRNLHDFKVSLDTSRMLIHDIPAQFIPISESGINDVKTIFELKQAGFRGFLIGETFMKTDHPAEALKSFTAKLKQP